MSKAQEPKPERLTMTITEAAATLGISRTLAYEQAKTGELPVIRLGRRVLVSRAKVRAMLEGQQ
jgi:excisionase family DNA binding protein